MNESFVKIKTADESDIDGVLDVQNKSSLLYQRNHGITDLELSNIGFIVFPLKPSEFKKAIGSPDHCIFLVAECNEEVLGYILAYDLGYWEKAGHNFDVVTVTNKKMFNHLKSDKSLYIRHIVVSSGKKGVALRLEDQLIQNAQAKDYKYLVAEVAKLPIQNNRSLEFHKKNGFEVVGEEPEGKFVWNIIMKETDGKIK